MHDYDIYCADGTIDYWDWGDDGGDEDEEWDEWDEDWD